MTPSPLPLWNAVQFNQALFGGIAAPAGLTPAQVGHGLLYPALRKAQVTLGPQRTPSDAQFQDAIEELNRLTGSLNCDRLNIYTNTHWVLPIVESKISYTIGISNDPEFIADFPVPRPQAIERANVLTFPGTPQEIRYSLALFTDLQWARISMQVLPNTIPSILYNNRAYPVSTLSFYGQPQPGYSLELYVWELIPQFSALTDVVLLPPGYEDALVLNLAVRLAPHFQKGAVPPDVRADAQTALMRIESINAPRPIARLPFGGCNYNNYNVKSDEFE